MRMIMRILIIFNSGILMRFMNRICVKIIQYQRIMFRKRVNTHYVNTSPQFQKQWFLQHQKNPVTKIMIALTSPFHYSQFTNLQDIESQKTLTSNSAPLALPSQQISKPSQQKQKNENEDTDEGIKTFCQVCKTKRINYEVERLKLEMQMQQERSKRLEQNIQERLKYSQLHDKLFESMEMNKELKEKLVDEKSRTRELNEENKRLREKLDDIQEGVKRKEREKRDRVLEQKWEMVYKQKLEDISNKFEETTISTQQKHEIEVRKLNKQIIKLKNQNEILNNEIYLLNSSKIKVNQKLYSLELTQTSKTQTINTLLLSILSQYQVIDQYQITYGHFQDPLDTILSLINTLIQFFSTISLKYSTITHFIQQKYKKYYPQTEQEQVSLMSHKRMVECFENKVKQRVLRQEKRIEELMKQIESLFGLDSGQQATRASILQTLSKMKIEGDEQIEI